jgi:hypothetical protein
VNLQLTYFKIRKPLFYIQKPQVFEYNLSFVQSVAEYEKPQKKQNPHKPQTKVLEFLVSILGGAQYLQDYMLNLDRTFTSLTH